MDKKRAANLADRIQEMKVYTIGDRFKTDWDGPTTVEVVSREKSTGKWTYEIQRVGKDGKASGPKMELTHAEIESERDSNKDFSFKGSSFRKEIEKATKKSEVHEAGAVYSSTQKDSIDDFIDAMAELADGMDKDAEEMYEYPKGLNDSPATVQFKDKDFEQKAKSILAKYGFKK